MNILLLYQNFQAYTYTYVLPRKVIVLLESFLPMDAICDWIYKIHEQSGKGNQTV